MYPEITNTLPTGARGCHLLPELNDPDSHVLPKLSTFAHIAPSDPLPKSLSLLPHAAPVLSFGWK